MSFKTNAKIMISISSIKLNSFNLYNPQCLKGIPHTPQKEQKQTNSLGQTYPAIYFTGELQRPHKVSLKHPSREIPQIDKTRPVTTQKMQAHLDSIYNNYQKSLNEISKEDIKKAVNNIEKSTNYSQKEILCAMQQATQFGNIKSINTIIKALNDNNILLSECDFSNNEQTFYDPNFGLNRALKYLINKKKMRDLQDLEFKRIKFGVFLDSKTLEKLEQGKKLHPKETSKILKNKNIKFFVLSGFDNGINFFDRSKDLETVTKELLQSKEIDKQIINKAKNLGIKPIIIKNENSPTIDNIYKQLQPEKMSKEELNATVDAALLVGLPYDKNIRNEVKNDVLQYIDNAMVVMTPETISKNLKNMHKQIVKYNAKLGRNQDDILYCIPEKEKSYDLINYQIQLIGNIPSNQFVDFDELLQDIDKPYFNDKTIVFLDDCAISGVSLFELYWVLDDIGFESKIPESNIIFAPVYATKKGYQNIQNVIDNLHRRNKDKIIYGTKETKNWNDNIKNSRFLTHVIGHSQYSKPKDFTKPCVIYPYMSPDNNCEIAANIAVLHDITHGDNKIFDRERGVKRIKSYSNLCEIIQITTQKLLNNEELPND